ncbi:sugar transferase [Ruegeria sediminis]|uniref:Sugar transferase n=1 Tax=Ruegeria sediminis TaxID=2583820 RepID=A0ABY2WWY4_9RHOB|nr:sugar transferase [Ruegeria sediminis]TMV07020.1 sugar transferase [Ruegeria sediminis]
MTAHSKDVVNVDVGYSEKIAVPAVARPSTVYRSAGKRVFDVIFVLVSAPIVVPLTLMFAAVLALQGVSPFFVQPRVGRNGKIFSMIKLRTMVRNADTVLEDHLEDNPEARDEWDRNQKLREDPRVIKFGTILRKSSMDELPQFWNVLVGDMSLVGPRPMMVCQKKHYPSKVYYIMRPGISGLWQVSRRNDSSFAERAEHDVQYWQELSLGTDLSILLRTIFVVLRGTGC